MRRELRGHVAARALAVVGEQPEGNFALAKLRDETFGAGNQLRAAIDHAIHVDEISMTHFDLLRWWVIRHHFLTIGFAMTVPFHA